MQSQCQFEVYKAMHKSHRTYYAVSCYPGLSGDYDARGKWMRCGSNNLRLRNLSWHNTDFKAILKPTVNIQTHKHTHIHNSFTLPAWLMKCRLWGYSTFAFRIGQTMKSSSNPCNTRREIFLLCVWVCVRESAFYRSFWFGVAATANSY